MIQIVAYHVTPSSETVENIYKSRSVNIKEDYLDLLQILFDSAKLFDRDAESVILTDERTAFGSLEKNARVYRYPFDAQVDPGIMLRRTESQVSFLETYGHQGHVAFLDSDMIINAPLGPVFQEDFDVGLTYRNIEEMPISGGVILVRQGSTDAAVRLLRRVSEVYQEKYAKDAFWWGDQYALIDVLGLKNFLNRSSDMLDVDGIRVRLFPCDEYNFSPDNHLRTVQRLIPDKVILHFKGERKEIMKIYWQAHLALRSRATPQNLVQALQARWKLRSA